MMTSYDRTSELQKEWQGLVVMDPASILGEQNTAGWFNKMTSEPSCIIKTVNGGTQL